MIKLASPDIQEDDIQRVNEVLRSGNLVQGMFVKELEQNVIDRTGISECAMVSSGTAALHLSLMALGIGPGDTVIVPAFTFPATANVVEVVGADILLCDVDLGSYIVTPERIDKLISENKSKNIRAVIVVHEFGYPAEIKRIADICKKNNLLLIEDAACAFGTLADGHSPGYYSELACYSFHPRKAITTGEGGAVVSRNKKLIEKINCLKNHGIENKNGSFDFVAAGLNYRITDFQAALAIGQFNRFNSELSKRKNLVNSYFMSLTNLKNISLPKRHDDHSWQSFMITLNRDINRTDIISKLAEQGIQSNLGAQAINCLTYYKNKYRFEYSTAINATYLYQQGLVLPLYSQLSEEDVLFISDKLRDI